MKSNFFDRKPVCSFTLASTFQNKYVQKYISKKKTNKISLLCKKKKENPISNISVSYTRIISEHVSFYKHVCPFVFFFPLTAYTIDYHWNNWARIIKKERKKKARKRNSWRKNDLSVRCLSRVHSYSRFIWTHSSYFHYFHGIHCTRLLLNVLHPLLFCDTYRFIVGCFCRGNVAR